MQTVYLGLGSNLGDREENIKRALAALAPELTVEKISALYETEPLYNPHQPRFLNGAAQASTGLSPAAVLAKVKSIEARMGEHGHNMPRVIDIDLLFYGDQQVRTPELEIPHPMIPERAFVLRPLAAIAPQFRHPTLGLTMAELLQKLV